MSKQNLIIMLMRRSDGATLAEMVVATGWQPHSVRGAISGAIKKKLCYTVEAAKTEDRGMVYRIVSGRR
jgi:hypothetical protein